MNVEYMVHMRKDSAECGRVGRYANPIGQAEPQRV